MNFNWGIGLEKNKYELEISLADLVGVGPTNFLLEAERVANNTGKISDRLFYLSELVKAIEDKRQD